MQRLSSPINIIKKSFDIFFEKSNLIYFLKIYAWLLPFQIFFLYQNYFIDQQSKALNIKNVQEIMFKYPWFLATVIIVNIVFLLVSFWVEVAGVKGIVGVVAGNRKSVKETFNSAKKILIPFSLLAILLGLIELGGMIILIIPGIIFSVWYSMSKFIFVVDGGGIVQSLKKSKNLVKGAFWKVFGRIITFAIFTFLFQSVFTLVPYGIGSVVSPFFGALFVIPYFLLFKELSE